MRKLLHLKASTSINSKFLLTIWISAMTPLTQILLSDSNHRYQYGPEAFIFLHYKSFKSSTSHRLIQGFWWHSLYKRNRLNNRKLGLFAISLLQPKLEAVVVLGKKAGVKIPQNGMKFDLKTSGNPKYDQLETFPSLVTHNIFSGYQAGYKIVNSHASCGSTFFRHLQGRSSLSYTIEVANLLVASVANGKLGSPCKMVAKYRSTESMRLKNFLHLLVSRKYNNNNNNPMDIYHLNMWVDKTNVVEHSLHCTLASLFLNESEW